MPECPNCGGYDCREVSDGWFVCHDCWEEFCEGSDLEVYFFEDEILPDELSGVRGDIGPSCQGS